MKTLAELQAECVELGITVHSNGRPSKEPYIAALQNHHWEREHAGEPLPPQVPPMLLSDWKDLDAGTALELESDHHAWIVQEKKDGVRALLHVDEHGVRITGRCTSEVTFRLSEYQANLPHLTRGLDSISGSILDGELVCPLAEVNTGNTVTTSPLQATVAVLSTSPDNAAEIQKDEQTKLRLYAFDILKLSGEDVTNLPLSERLGLLVETAKKIDNPYIEIVPSFAVNKAAIHERIIAAGGEGTVWKKAGEPYEPGRRVKHWIKRKRDIQVEAFVTDFKLGTPGRGHAHLIGAVEFSIPNGDDKPKPIAWVSGWSDRERDIMTWKDRNGKPTLNPTCYGRRAIIVGQDEAGRSQRLRHARLKAWMAANLPLISVAKPN